MILEFLNKNRDIPYSEFQKKLIPHIEQEKILGVRTPILRNYAKEIKNTEEAAIFLNKLPHDYFDEDQLHAFLISLNKNFEETIKQINLFLPYINNWATCDQLSPKIFKKYKKELLPYIDDWITSEHTYTVRFGIGMLLQFYLDEDFDPEYMRKVSRIRSEEYYINMEIAWYLATALAKQWDAVIPLIEEKSMDKWVQNKTIQKARESYRITAEQKEYLKTLKL